MSCDTAGGLLIYYYINFGIKLIMIMAPIILLVLGTIDFMGAVTAGDEKGMKKSIQTFLKRMIICVIILILPTIISLIMSFSSVESTLFNCLDKATKENVKLKEQEEKANKESLLKKMQKEEKEKENNSKVQKEVEVLNAKSVFSTNKYDDMSYHINIPENATTNMPLVIFLHGAGECGGNGFSSLANFPLTKFASAYANEKFVFLEPNTKMCSWEDQNIINKLINLIDYISNTYSIDKNRIYLTGHSLGARGVYVVTQQNPNKFAGVVAMSGYGNIEVNKFINTPIRIYGGIGNDSTYAKDGQSKCAKINQAGGNCIYKSVSTNHGQVSNAAYNDELFDWLLKQ